MRTKKSIEERIGKAVLEGWSFSQFRKANYSTGRHTVWVSRPEEDNQWFVQKVDGALPNHVEALLDSLGL